MFAPYNPNPKGRSVSDCSVRALSKALEQSWEATYVDLALEGMKQGDLPHADSVWGRVLRNKGFQRHFIPDDCPDCMTVERFSEENPEGIFVLSMPGKHVVTVVDGDWCDSWDSGNECPTYYYSKE